eukprot:COSAG05_NODE_79_length_21178_cov_133.299492_4_plen_155_part_00
MFAQRCTIGRQKYLVLESAPSALPVSTIILTAPDQHTLDELSAVVSAAVRVLAGAMQSDGVAYVLQGAGKTELFLAKVLRDLCCVQTGQHHNIPMEIVKVLENFAWCLETCGFADAVLTNAETVVDSLRPKLAALRTAVEVANALLRVDGLVEE